MIFKKGVPKKWIRTKRTMTDSKTTTIITTTETTTKKNRTTTYNLAL